jgi:hypothetical protein
MFDWYEPDLSATCPSCGSPVIGWQGYDGPCALLVWEQGRRHPVAQRADEDARLSSVELLNYTLPPSFSLTGWCENNHALAASGHCNEAGIWDRTQLRAEP